MANTLYATLIGTIASVNNYTDKIRFSFPFSTGEDADAKTVWVTCFLQGEKRVANFKGKKGDKIFVQGRINFHYYNNELSLNLNVAEYRVFTNGEVEETKAEHESNVGSRTKVVSGGGGKRKKTQSE